MVLRGCCINQYSSTGDLIKIKVEFSLGGTLASESNKLPGDAVFQASDHTLSSMNRENITVLQIHAQVLTLFYIHM